MLTTNFFHWLSLDWPSRPPAIALGPEVMARNFFHWLSNSSHWLSLDMPSMPPGIAYDIFGILMVALKAVNGDEPFMARLLVLLAELNSTEEHVMMCVSFTMTACSQEILASDTIRLLNEYAKYRDRPFFSAKKICIVGMFRSLALGYDVEGLAMVQKSSEQEKVLSKREEHQGEPHQVSEEMISVSSGKIPQSVLSLIAKVYRSTAFRIEKLDINELVWDVVNGITSKCIGQWVLFIVKFVYDCSPSQFMDNECWTGVGRLLIRVTKHYLHSQYMYMP